MPHRRKVAFVSGKGGVGKTALAANFALCASTRLRTVLIDFDFQNQGSTGLLAQYAKPGCPNAFDMLVAGKVDGAGIIELRDRLFFVPAFDPSLTDRYGSQLTSPFNNLSPARIDKLLGDLQAAGDFELVVVDCHGGLDDVSFSSFISSDTTFIVTEADKVTFNGTLELLDFYLTRAATIGSGVGREMDDQLKRRLLNIESNKVRFLINRVSGKFDFSSLNDILTRQLYSNFEVLREMTEGLSFFPADQLLAESFSEYPFFIELLPEAIFSQKIELLFEQAIGMRPALEGRGWLYEWTERMSERRLQHYVKSPQDERVQAVFSFVAVSEVLFSVAMIILVAASTIPGVSSLFDKMSDWTESVFLNGLLIAALFLMFYIGNFNLQISKAFRDRLRYETRLYRRGIRTATITFVLRVTRVFFFRMCTLMWSALFFAGIVLTVIARFV